MLDVDYKTALEQGIKCAQEGNTLLARMHLEQAAQANPDDPNIWLWHAWVCDSPAAMTHSLEEVLSRHPQNQVARAGLMWASSMAEFQFESEKASAPTIDNEQSETPLADESAEEEAADDSDPIDQIDELINVVNEEVAPEEQTQEPAEPLEETQVAAQEDANLEEDVNQPEEAATEEITAEDTESEVGAEADDAELPRSAWSALGKYSGIGNEENTPDEIDATADVVAEAVAASEDASNEESSDTIVEEVAEETAADDIAEPDESQMLVETMVEFKVEDVPTTDTLAETTEERTVEEAAETEVQAEEAAEDTAESTVAEASEQTVEETVEEAAADTTIVEEPTVGNNDAEEPVEDTNDDRPTILVVDDSPTVRKLVSMTLTKQGYKVIGAFDGVAAIKEIAAHNPCLVLLDINMPRLDGYQLCKLIKKHEATAHIPVVMLSGKDGMFDKLRGRLVGCTAYLTKPFVPEVLIETVETELATARA